MMLTLALAAAPRLIPHFTAQSGPLNWEISDGHAGHMLGQARRFTTMIIEFRINIFADCAQGAAPGGPGPRGIRRVSAPGSRDHGDEPPVQDVARGGPGRLSR